MAPPSGSRRVFGQSMGKSKKRSTNYQRQFGGGGGKNQHSLIASSSSSASNEETLAAKRRIRQQKAERIDEKFGYETFAFENTNGTDSQQIREKRGWLFNILPTTVRTCSKTR